jgi:Asp-tRNA(Asn)/Glu-tRNA(Gln) amidotransferase B subunit
MMSGIVKEFIHHGILSEDNALILVGHLLPDPIPLTYPEGVAMVTLSMLRHNLATYTESSPIRQALADLFVENPKEHQKLVGGDQKLAGFFMGRVMKVSKNFNPKDVQKRIAEMVDEEKQTYEWELVPCSSH